MVTPLDTSPENLLRGVVTRITLRYSKEAKKDYARLLEAIQDIPDTVIFFLRRLKMIYINVTGVGGKVSRILKSEDKLKPWRRIITCTRARDGITTTEHCLFLLFRTIRNNIPNHRRRKHRREAVVELAFPIHSLTGQPKTSSSGQHVFAFLPVRELVELRVSHCSCPRSVVNQIATVFDQFGLHHLSKQRGHGRLRVQRCNQRRNRPCICFCCHKYLHYI